MIIDFDQVIMLLDGTPMKLTADADAPDLTLAVVCAEACLRALDDDAAQPGLAARLFNLAARINAGGARDVDAEDVGIIKRRIERSFGPLVVGRSWDLLEGRGEEEARVDAIRPTEMTRPALNPPGKSRARR